MTESFKALDIDKTYRFLANKTLHTDGVPEAALDVLERVDEKYLAFPAGHFQQVIGAARQPVKPDGAPYAIFRDADSSEDTALVIPLPYCNPVIPDVMDSVAVSQAVRQGDHKAFDSNTWNNGEKHLFLFEIMKGLGVRDEAGKTIPVITVGADSQDYQPKLDKLPKRALRHGDLYPYVRNMEDVLEHNGYGRVHVGGYSQGGSVAHQFAVEAHNFDVASLTVAEAPTYKNRSARELAVNYLLNRPDSNPGVSGEDFDKELEDLKWTEDGPQSRKDLENIRNRAFTTMFKTIVRRNGAWRTALGLTHATMIDALRSAEEYSDFPITLGWNDTSALTHDIEENLSNKVSYVLDRLRLTGRLRTVKAVGHEAVGAPHLAGESPMYYSLLMGEAVQWAGSTNR